MRVAHIPLCIGQRTHIASVLRGLQGRLGVDHGLEACAAVHHHRVVNAQVVLHQIGLEHFELQTDAPGFASEHELRVGKRKPVSRSGLGSAVGLRLQIGPCFGTSVGVEGAGNVHDVKSVG